MLKCYTIGLNTYTISYNTFYEEIKPNKTTSFNKNNLKKTSVCILITYLQINNKIK